MRKYNFVSAERDQKHCGARNGKNQEQRSFLTYLLPGAESILRS